MSTFNPLFCKIRIFQVDEDGVVNISVAWPEWSPGKDYVITVLSWLKRIFYQREWFIAGPDNEAKTLWVEIHFFSEALDHWK